MFFRARRALGRARFDIICRPLLSTPPIPASDSPLTLVSMVCHGEVMMYLLAAKSFCRHLGRTPRIVVLNDGSLTKGDYTKLRAQIPEVRVVSIAEVAPANTPTGSCWERLLLISDLAADSFIVQMDSDTITVGAIPEVIECIDANRCFTLLGDRSFPEVEPMTSACMRSKTNLHPMVQAVCERNFDQLRECAYLRYIRGNAGFNGFAKGSITREKVEWFSELMRRLVREQWDEWGSEQLTSNLLIANSDDAYPLSFPKYLSYWAHPEVPYDDASFIHFIGPHRYSNGLYLKKAAQVIAALSKEI